METLRKVSTNTVYKIINYDNDRHRIENYECNEYLALFVRFILRKVNVKLSNLISEEYTFLFRLLFASFTFYIIAFVQQGKTINQKRKFVKQ